MVTYQNMVAVRVEDVKSAGPELAEELRNHDEDEIVVISPSQYGELGVFHGVDWEEVLEVL